MKQYSWFKLQEWVASQLKEFDLYARSTKQSGAGGESGDVKNSLNLNIECKLRNLKTVFNQDWLTKCEEEIPLHSKKVALVITENKYGKKVAHLNAEDFFRIFKKSLFR